LHDSEALPSVTHQGYPIVSGVLETEAIKLLRSFYERENYHAPGDKRKKKPHIDTKQSKEEG
jgi:tRNA-specific adenosine deaminase 2